MPRALLFFISFAILFGQTRPSLGDAFRTTDDGSQLYFVSNLMLRGSTDENPRASRLFKLVNGTYSLVSQFPSGGPWYPMEPRLSGDGTVVGYVASQGCGNSCNLSSGQGYETVLQFPNSATPVTLPGYCQISRIPQYALCVLAQPSLQQVAIVNIATMQTSALQNTACHGRNLLTSDGQALAWDKNHVVLFTAANVQQLPFTVDDCPAISDDGSTIVYVSNQKLFTYNVATGASTLLNGDLVRSFAIDGVSNDGTVILQAGVMYRTTDGAVIPLISPFGDWPSVLAGGGQYAWNAFTKFGQSGDVGDFTDPTPTFAINGTVVPGSQVVIQGQNFTDVSAHALTFPGPTSLAGVQVKINGTPIPLLSVSPTTVNIQIPWELTGGTLELDTQGNSAFVQGPISLFVGDWAPVRASPAIKADFSAEIGQSNPANPGDVVNFYLTGIGPVSPAVKDFVPTPANPLPFATRSFQIVYQPAPGSASTALPIYYAGLAPGLIGIYQLTVQTPLQVSKTPGGAVPVLLSLYLRLPQPVLVNPVNLPVWMTPNQ
jgi:uncharacterized protein (TIGR03437 family)